MENTAPLIQKDSIKYEVEHLLPDFSRLCQEALSKNLPIVMHQDTHAVDYDDDELFLLAAAIKYAGMVGIPILVWGTNGESLQKSWKQHVGRLVKFVIRIPEAFIQK